MHGSGARGLWIAAAGVGLSAGVAFAQFGGLGTASPSAEFDLGTGEAIEVRGGDVTGDGINDSVFALSSGYVGYVAGRGDGIVGQPVLIATNDGDANSIELFDYDQDGDLDVLRAADLSGGELRLYRNDGSGGFSLDFAISGVGALSQKFGLRLGDYDNDGDDDVFLLRTGGVTVVENLGNTFSLTPLNADYPNFVGAAMDAGDVNGDGRADAVVLSTSLNEIVVIESRVAGPVVVDRIAFAASPGEVRLVDMDQDGDLDLVASTLGADRIDVHRNNGSGDFSFGYSLFISDPREFEVADMDADGSLDIVVLARGGPGFTFDDRVVIFLNDGKGFFGQYPDVYDMFFADFDTITVSSITPTTGPDVIAVEHTFTGRVVLRENQTAFLAPEPFVLLSPANGASGLATPQEVSAWGGRVRPLAEWRPAGGFGVTYDLVIATNPGLTNVVAEINGLTTPWADLGSVSLNPGTTYYWGVTAFNTAGSTAATGGPFVFSTRGECPPDLAPPFGVLNFFDLQAYLASYNAGCP
jgi:hypothetical protein